MSRGKGRGSARGVSNIEALGIKSRDGIPPPLLHPPPLFPPLEKKPLELKNDETTQYLSLVKQELNHFMRQSPFYLKPILQQSAAGNNSIIKYSDRYKTTSSNDLTDLLNSIPNWKDYMPKELHFVKRKPARKTADHLSKKNLLEIGERLKRLEEREETVTAAGESEDDEGVRTEDEYYDEEIEEEEGDYQQTYFDPGDGFGADDDDAIDDGPSY